LVANFGPAVHNITVSRPVGGAVKEKIDSSYIGNIVN